MNVITAVAEIQADRDRMTGSIGLVRTMGHLHSCPVRAELVEASRPPRL
jgi:pantothenate synthetase